MADQNSADEIIASFNFTGGFPDRKDLAPSIIFLVVYCISAPVLVWRLSTKAHRTMILFRPTLFILCRLGMLGLRAWMSTAYPNYNVSELVAELILVSIGYIFLCDSMVGLWKRNIESVVPMHQSPRWVQLLARLLQLLLMASVATIIASSVMSSSFYSATSAPSASAIQQVVQLRHASYCCSFAVPVVLLFALFTTYREFHLPKKQTAYILIPGLSLVIVGAYRVAQTFSLKASDPARSKAAFWILQILFEMVAYMSFLTISIPTWYPLPDTTSTQQDIETAQDKNTNWHSVGPQMEFNGASGSGSYRNQQQPQQQFGFGGRRQRGGLIGGLLIPAVGELVNKARK